MTMMTSSMYRMVSTMLVIVCVLYLCLISVSHLDFQTTHLYNHEHTVSSTKDQIFAYIDPQNWTRQKHSTLVNKSVQHQHSLLITTTQPKMHQHLPIYSSDKYMMNVSNQIKSSVDNSKKKRLDERHNSRKKRLDEWKPELVRKLAETRKSQQTTGASQAYMEPHINHLISGTNALRVSQHNVNFLPLGELYVYGTFLDRRYPEGGYVRNLILRPSANQTRQVWCQFYGTHNRVVNVKAEPYEMCENHGKKNGGWIYSCPVPEIASDQHQTVSLLYVTDNRVTVDSLMSIPLQTLDIVSGEGNRKSEYNLDIQQKLGFDDDAITSTTQTTWEHKLHVEETNLSLGVCVPPLYGNICLSKLINFIEMCRLLGADKVFLYIYDIPKDILSFLQNYTGSQPDILTLVLWNFPITNQRTSQTDNNQDIWNHGQLLAVQHCLYTNMAQFDWLLFIDIDEMLVPLKARTWPELLSGIVGLDTTIAGVSFESAFFQQDFQTQVTNSIDYFQYLYRTKETSIQRSKLFVRPSRVFELGIHHLSRTTSDNMYVVKAGTDHGLLHHYRKCISDYGAENDLRCQVLVKDETILKYEVPLTISSRQVTTGAMEYFAHYR